MRGYCISAGVVLGVQCTMLGIHLNTMNNVGIHFIQCAILVIHLTIQYTMYSIHGLTVTKCSVCIVCI